MKNRRCMFLAGCCVATLALLPVAASTQDDGALLLFSDPEYTSCTLIDVADQEYTVYIVHVDENGVAGAEFAVLNFSNLTYVGESITWTFIGNVPGGLSVLYDNQCRTGEILVGETYYSGAGTSPACSQLRIVESPFSNPPAVGIDCDFEKVFPFEGRLWINPDGSCPCEFPVPVESTTWGRIKAMYD